MRVVGPRPKAKQFSSRDLHLLIAAVDEPKVKVLVQRQRRLPRPARKRTKPGQSLESSSNLQVYIKETHIIISPKFEEVSLLFKLYSNTEGEKILALQLGEPLSGEACHWDRGEIHSARRVQGLQTFIDSVIANTMRAAGGGSPGGRVASFTKLLQKLLLQLLDLLLLRRIILEASRRTDSGKVGLSRVRATKLNPIVSAVGAAVDVGGLSFGGESALLSSHGYTWFRNRMLIARLKVLSLQRKTKLHCVQTSLPMIIDPALQGRSQLGQLVLLHQAHVLHGNLGARRTIQQILQGSTRKLC